MSHLSCRQNQTRYCIQHKNVGQLSTRAFGGPLGCWKAGFTTIEKSSFNFGISYSSVEIKKIVGYCNSNWAQERPDQKLLTGFIFLRPGGAISRKSCKQPNVTQSSQKAERIALSYAIGSSSVFKTSNTTIPGQKKTLKIGEVSDRCNHLVKNTMKDGSMHIVVKYQMIVDNVKQDKIQTFFISSVKNMADVVAKLQRNILNSIFYSVLSLGTSETNILWGGVLRKSVH